MLLPTALLVACSAGGGGYALDGGGAGGEAGNPFAILGKNDAGKEAAAGTMTAADALTNALDFGGQAAEHQGAMPEGMSGGPSVPSGSGVMEIKPGTTVVFNVPWSGGPVDGVNIGFGGSKYFGAPAGAIGSSSSGGVMVQAKVASDLCANLANVCHQIKCYESVTFPGGQTFSKAAAMAIVVNCTGQDCMGNPSDAGSKDATGDASSCNSMQVAGADIAETRVIELSKSSGSFLFSYNTYSQEDQMTVIYEGKTLFDTGCVGASKTQTITYSGKSTQVTISVKPNCNGGSGTAWDFTAACPM